MVDKINKVLILFLLSLSTQAFAEGSKVRSKISDVTVFLSGAQVTRTAAFNVPEGRSEIVLSELSTKLNDNSLNLRLDGSGLTVLGIKPRVNYLDDQKLKGEAAKLEKQLEGLSKRLREITDEQDVFSSEADMIRTNHSIGGTNTALTPEQLRAMADFMRKRMQEIKATLRKLDTEKDDLTETEIRTVAQLQSINAKLRYAHSKEVVITLQAEKTVNVKAEFNYLISEAGWYPVYDLRAENTSSPVNLRYQAKVWQKSGFDWKDIELTLSTGNPSLGAQRRKLSKRWITFKPEIQAYNNKEKVYYDETRSADDGWGESEEELDMGFAEAPAVETDRKALAVSFKVETKYTVKSDGQEQLVQVQESKLPAEFVYIAAPTVNNDVFLLAYVTEWEKYNLISGSANVYFRGSFVGETYMDTQNTSDSLELSMGRDGRITMDRKTLEDFNSRKMIGSNQTETKGFEITLRNNRDEEVEVLVKETIPVSTDKRIEVEIEKDGGGEFDPGTGIITWRVKIKPGKTASVKYSYSLKYPKGKEVEEYVE